MAATVCAAPITASGARALELRAAGRFADAAVAEAKAVTGFGAATEQDADRAREKEQSHWASIRANLLRAVCSAAWADDIYGPMRRGELRDKPRLHPLRAYLRRIELYPPGGIHTKMVWCDCCDRPVPPQAVFAPLLCRGCMEARGADETRVHGVSSPGRCYSCGKRAMGAGWKMLDVRRVNVCVECDSNAMSPEQVAKGPSAHRTDRPMRVRDVAAHFEHAGYRRSRRTRHRWDDDRSIGGWIDEAGIMREWVGFANVDVGEEAAQNAETSEITNRP